MKADRVAVGALLSALAVALAACSGSDGRGIGAEVEPTSATTSSTESSIAPGSPVPQQDGSTHQEELATAPTTQTTSGLDEAPSAPNSVGSECNGAGGASPAEHGRYHYSADFDDPTANQSLAREAISFVGPVQRYEHDASGNRVEGPWHDVLLFSRVGAISYVYRVDSGCLRLAEISYDGYFGEGTYASSAAPAFIDLRGKGSAWSFQLSEVDGSRRFDVEMRSLGEKLVSTPAGDIPSFGFALDGTVRGGDEDETHMAEMWFARSTSLAARHEETVRTAKYGTTQFEAVLLSESPEPLMR